MGARPALILSATRRQDARRGLRELSDAPTVTDPVPRLGQIPPAVRAEARGWRPHIRPPGCRAVWAWGRTGTPAHPLTHSVLDLFLQGGGVFGSPPTPNPAPGQWRGWVTSVGCELRGSRPCREGITGLELSAGYLLSNASLLSEFVSPCVDGSVSWAQNYRLTQVPLVARSNPRKGPEFNSGNEREGRRSGSLGPAPPNSSLERPLRGAARGVSPCQVSQECVGALTRTAVMRRRAPLTCLSQSGRTATPRTRVLY